MQLNVLSICRNRKHYVDKKIKGGDCYATNKMDSLEGDGSFTEPLQ